MALINNIYVFVDSEKINRNTEIPQHPVEKGLPLTDSIRVEPKTLSISGKIVNVGNLKADTIVSKIEKLRTTGSLIDYKGNNVVGNFMIKSFNTDDNNKNNGGHDFDMELVEVRIAKSAYNKKKTASSDKKNNPTLKVGAIVVFKGGSVYKASDSKNAAANRGRQTCKITLISTKSWSKHQYHLISTEKKYPYNVYGWVDKANIEGTGNTGTASKTNGGTQQVKKKETTKNKTTTTTKDTKKTPDILLSMGKSTAQLIVGSEKFFNDNIVTVNNTQYYQSGVLYYPVSYAKTMKYDGGRSTGKGFPAGTPIYRKQIASR